MGTRSFSQMQERQKTTNPRKGIETDQLIEWLAIPAGSLSQKTTNPRKGIETHTPFLLPLPYLKKCQKTTNPRKGIETNRRDGC